MNAVFIRHFDNRQYLFEVPENIKLKEGDRVMVRNRRGEVDGICTCDSFELEGSRGGSGWGNASIEARSR